MREKIVVLVAMLLSSVAFAAETNSISADAEANYTKAIEGRTAAILKILALNDTNKAANVHDIIIAQFRALNAWHDANNPKLKAVRSDTIAIAQIRVSLKALHDEFLSKLARYLTPEQVEQVKDKMTYG